MQRILIFIRQMHDNLKNLCLLTSDFYQLSPHYNSIPYQEFLYFFIGLVAIGGIFFLGVFVLKKRNGQYEPRKEVKGPQVRKLSDFLEERKHRMNEGYGVSLAEAEKKLKEAQVEINKLKNAGKIEQAKKKLVDDERNLMRLRRGE